MQSNMYLYNNRPIEVPEQIYVHTNDRVFSDNEVFFKYTKDGNVKIDNKNLELKLYNINFNLNMFTVELKNFNNENKKFIISSLPMHDLMLTEFNQDAFSKIFSNTTYSFGLYQNCVIPIPSSVIKERYKLKEVTKDVSFKFGNAIVFMNGDEWEHVSVVENWRRDMGLVCLTCYSSVDEDDVGKSYRLPRDNMKNAKYYVEKY